MCFKLKHEYSCRGANVCVPLRYLWDDKQVKDREFWCLIRVGAVRLLYTMESTDFYTFCSSRHFPQKFSSAAGRAQGQTLPHHWGRWRPVWWAHHISAKVRNVASQSMQVETDGERRDGAVMSAPKHRDEKKTPGWKIKVHKPQNLEVLRSRHRRSRLWTGDTCLDKTHNGEKPTRTGVEGKAMVTGASSRVAAAACINPPQF